MISKRIFATSLVALLGACSDRAAVSEPEAITSFEGTPSFVLGLPGDATADTLNIGQTVQLTASQLTKKRGRTSPTTVTWTSSTPAVATVSSSGLVAGVTAGSASITASNNMGSERVTILVVASAPAPAPAPAPVGSPAEMPRAYVNTDPVSVTGVTRTVGTAAEFQTALNNAQPGDAIVLQAGVTYTGNFVLPVKSGTGWITIRSSAIADLAAGRRVTPANAVSMPKLVSANANPVLRTASGAHHYRLIGLEVTAAPSVTASYTLVALGTAGSEQASLSQVPTHLVLDRMYVHGHSTLSFQRCIALNSAHSAVIHSHVSECHGRGFDSQAIVGWNGPGPFAIIDNHLEGAGENVMFGGAAPSISGLVPSDIEFRRNFLSKPDAWRGVWTVKNIFELKMVRRILIEGNVFQNNWIDAQNGFAILFMSASDCAAPWMETSDVTFRLNILRDTPHGLSAAGRPGGDCLSTPMARVYIAQNLFERVAGRLWQFSDVSALHVQHNTGVGGSHGLILYGEAVPGLVVVDNLFGVPSTDQYPMMSAAGQGFGSSALNAHASGWVFARNAVTGTNGSGYPAGNGFALSAASAGMVSYPSDLRLLSTSPFYSLGLNSTPAGVDWTALGEATAGVGPR